MDFLIPPGGARSADARLMRARTAVSRSFIEGRVAVVFLYIF